MLIGDSLRIYVNSWFEIIIKCYQKVTLSKLMQCLKNETHYKVYI